MESVQLVVADIRQRMTAAEGHLTAFNGSIFLSSQNRIERILLTFIGEAREGRHEDSVRSFPTSDSLSGGDPAAWRQIRKKRETIGISLALFLEHKDFILGTLEKAKVEGASDGLPADEMIEMETASPPSKGVLWNTEVDMELGELQGGPESWDNRAKAEHHNETQ
ncbi:MAG: hypothetical protein M1838_002400 [Thelocarpon superellum]|nr:MAG: hypothetical protein M1838_002400 [Thelocarpon superellum]